MDNRTEHQLADCLRVNHQLAELTGTPGGLSAEKMFGIESRSLKACHELLEVRGFTACMTAPLALINQNAAGKAHKSLTWLDLCFWCSLLARLPRACQFLVIVASTAEVSAVLFPCRRASRTWCTWRAACRSGGMTASQLMASSLRSGDTACGGQLACQSMEGQLLHLSELFRGLPPWVERRGQAYCRHPRCFAA